MCASIYPNEDDIYFCINQCLDLSKAENTKNELNRPPKRSNAFRSQVSSFFVFNLGHLKKLWLELDHTVLV